MAHCRKVPGGTTDTNIPHISWWIVVSDLRRINLSQRIRLYGNLLCLTNSETQAPLEAEVAWRRFQYRETAR